MVVVKQQKIRNPIDLEDEISSSLWPPTSSPSVEEQLLLLSLTTNEPLTEEIMSQQQANCDVQNPEPNFEMTMHLNSSYGSSSKKSRSMKKTAGRTSKAKFKTERANKAPGTAAQRKMYVRMHAKHDKAGHLHPLTDARSMDIFLEVNWLRLDLIDTFRGYVCKREYFVRSKKKVIASLQDAIVNFAAAA